MANHSTPMTEGYAIVDANRSNWKPDGWLITPNAAPLYKTEAAARRELATVNGGVVAKVTMTFEEVN